MKAILKWPLIFLIGLQSIFAETKLAKVRVLDRENGWPVPMVELRTTHNVSFHTDNAGVAAIDLPELWGQETWLHVRTDGYEIEADGFGNRGVRLNLSPGKTYEIKVDRTILAKRLGRVTGAGIFAESQKLGEQLSWDESGVFGTDSIQSAIHRGKLYWAWGDTNLAKYPLGLFHMSSATIPNQPLVSLEPPLALELEYFRAPAGAVRSVANVAPKLPGPTWVSGYVSLKDHAGVGHLVGTYTKIKPPLESYREGLCVWNDESENFESIRVLWDQKTGMKKTRLLPKGHPIFWTDEDEKEWLLFGDPFPTIKMPATFEAWKDPETWRPVETFQELQNSSGNKIKVHTGSVAWNSFRKKWITIFVELDGVPSFLGEVWYSEADSPFGPWRSPVKILSHEKHTFYNPRIHPELTPKNSSTLVFDGTYTQTFSKGAEKTPRYDYNQIMYRLDLDEIEAAE